MDPAARPKTLLDAIRYFSDLDVCNEFVARLRWPNGPVCPRCGCAEHSYLTTRRVWKCKGCKKQYSVKLGTIFEDSPLGLDKWLPALLISANSRHAISSHELARLLGVTQKSAWFMLQRIRLAMQTDSFLLASDASVAKPASGGEGRDRRRTVRARKVGAPRPGDAPGVRPHGAGRPGSTRRAGAVASR
jgi:transposase-like protein